MDDRRRPDGSPYASVGGLTKGLSLLAALSREGVGSALSLSRSTGIPRPTVHRLLATLIGCGWVSQDARGGGYRLTSMATTLADGYRHDDRIWAVSAPVLDALRREVAWPTDVAVCSGGYMVVCASTHDRNPLSLDRVVRGRRVRIVTSALGRAHLAFCPEAERQALLESLRPGTALEREWLDEPELLHRELAATRERGYALRLRGTQPRTCSIAVPAMHGDAVVACINIHWIARALTPEVAVGRYLEPLRRAARRLEAGYAASLAA